MVPKCYMLLCPCVYGLNQSDHLALGYKTFFVLSSTEHEIFPAHKC